MNGVLGYNVRTLGVNRDNILAAALALGGRYLLVQDDPALAVQAASVGMKVIYRQSGDETLRLDPAAFVAERAKNAPNAVYIHLTNELDPTPELLAWTSEAIRYADTIKRKVCALNYSTHRSKAQWEASKNCVLRAVSSGHAIGAHIYSRYNSDPDALVYRSLKHQLGGTWLCTEFGYAIDAYHGWRGTLSEQQYADFCAAWLPQFAAENMPVLLFSFDHWTHNEEGKAHGFGVNDALTLMSRLAALNARYPIQDTKPMPTPPTPPPTPSGAPVAMTVTATAGLNLRASIPSGAVIRTMPFNEAVTGYPDTKQTAGGYDWIVVQDAQENVGYAAALYLKAASVPAPAFKLLAPFKRYVVTSRFNDPRSYPFAPTKKQLHEGIDGVDGIAQQYGSDPTVHVGAAGTVVKIGYDAQGYGNYCLVDFGDNWRGWYAHFEAIYVREGQPVASGQILGLMGGTGGTSTAPHCHITLQHIGHGLDGYVVADVVDPAPYMVTW